MQGPKIQQPQALSPVTQPDSDIASVEYANFFNILQLVTFYSTRSGTTAERPTASTLARWIGMPYLDTTLGKPIWLKIASTNIWIDATGASV